jgi:hypothetical protein
MHTDEHGFGKGKTEGFNTESTEVTEGYRENTTQKLAGW